MNAVYVYQSSLLLAAICAFLLPFATKYEELIAFSCVYGLADGISITTHTFILLSCVDAKRRTAAFVMNNVLFAIPLAAGGPIIGKFTIEPLPSIESGHSFAYHRDLGPLACS